MSETIINVEKSPVLVGLIKKLIIALDPLSAHDTSIKKFARSILMCLNNPDGCMAETLVDNLDSLGAIVKSYNIKVQEGNITNPIQAIPHLLYAARQEVDHLMTIKRIEKSDLKVATPVSDLLVKIDDFFKATSGE